MLVEIIVFIAAVSVPTITFFLGVQVAHYKLKPEIARLQALLKFERSLKDDV